MSSRNKIYKFCFSAHKSITDPIEKRVVELFTIFILAVAPAGPLVWLFQDHLDLVGEDEIGVGWLVMVMTSSLLCYTLVRSSLYVWSIYLQIFCALLFPYLTVLTHPHASSSYLTFIFPVCLAALLLSFRKLLVVSLIVFLGFGSLFPLVDVQYHKQLLSTYAMFTIVVFMLLLIRYHRKWIDTEVQKQLSRQYKRHMELINITFDGTATIVDGTFRDVDVGFAKFLKTRPEELIGQPIRDFFPNIPPSLNTVSEMSIEDAEGRIRYIQLARQSIDNRGYLFAIRDLTLERIEQAERMQIDRMTSTGTIASGIAHELNTPLMIAMTQNQMALRDLHSESTVKIETRLNTTQDVLERMGSILKDLHWFVKPSSENHTQSPREVIENTIRLVNHRIGHMSRIEVDIGTDIPVGMPENQLNQVLINLLLNAAEARRSELDVIDINLKTELCKEFYKITIQDNGVGIPITEKSKIFEPFFTSNKNRGTGLGLAICKGLLSKVGGTISAQSNTSGSLFSVLIPVLPPAPTKQEPNGRTKVIKNIIIIDDDPILLELLDGMLYDYNCKTANSIAAGLSLIKKTPVDIILCDMIMQQGGGRELFMELQRTSPKDRDKILFLTGGIVDPEMQSFVDSCARPILYKPFTRADLISMFNKI